MIAFASHNEPDDGSSLSAIAARLQRRLQDVREIWLSTAAELRGITESALPRGQFPQQQVATVCERLLRSREQLAVDIRMATVPLQLPDWTPPGADEDFGAVEESLADLAAICGELDRVTAERLAGHLQLLARVQRLVASSPEIETPLRQLQQQAVMLQRQLQECCHSVTDREVERQLEVFSAALLLVADAESRAGSDRLTRNSPGAVAAAFQITMESSSLLLAVGLLRGNCRPQDDSAAEQDAEPREHDAEPAEQAGPEPAVVEKQQVAVSSGLQLTETAAKTAAGPQPLQLERLLNRFSQQHRLGDVGRVSGGGTTANRGLRKLTLREVAAMSQPLRRKAAQMDSRLPAAEKSNGGSSLVSALRCTALAIDCVAMVQRDYGKTGCFSRRDLEQTFSLLDEALQQSLQAKSRLPGSATQLLPELNQIAGWLEVSQAALDSGKHRHQPRSMPGVRPGAEPLQQRLSDICRGLHQRQQRQTLLGRASQSCLRLQAAECEEDALSACTELDGFISQLLSLGLSPNDAELRNSLLPFLELFLDASDVRSLRADEASGVANTPENLPEPAPFRWSQGMLTVLQHLQQWQETHPAEEVAEESRADSVATVRRLLSGKLLVVVGGVCRPHAAERLKREFDVCELRWLNATRADRVDHFQPELRGAAVVVLITRLMGHKHTRIHDLCRPLAIPCVQTRYNAGYSVNQIADVILTQASQQLMGG